MAESPIRIVISVDIDAESPERAYERLCTCTGLLGEVGIGWESTDEWYGYDGEPVPQSVIDEITANSTG